MIEFPGAFGGTVMMTFDEADQKTPDSVMIFATLEQGLLMTFNPARGWELPGGKIEAGETPLRAVIRETFEETGAVLQDIMWIAQYEVVGGKPDYLCKWVFYASVKHLGPRPAGFETTDCKLISPWPKPEQIEEDLSFSPLVRDQVYALILNRIASNTKTRSSC
ncbi:MAG: hydrolase [Bacilli bacterium]|nr:hydrolase [Bacilli bacterium]